MPPLSIRKFTVNQYKLLTNTLIVNRNGQKKKTNLHPYKRSLRFDYWIEISCVYR